MFPHQNGQINPDTNSATRNGEMTVTAYQTIIERICSNSILSRKREVNVIQNNLNRFFDLQTWTSKIRLPTYHQNRNLHAPICAYVAEFGYIARVNVGSLLQDKRNPSNLKHFFALLTSD
jgi:hypothetical protein